VKRTVVEVDDYIVECDYYEISEEIGFTLRNKQGKFIFSNLYSNSGDYVSKFIEDTLTRKIDLRQYNNKINASLRLRILFKV